MATDLFAAFGLNEQQQTEARRIYERMMPLYEEEMIRISCSLASKDNSELSGKTEFQLREQVHRLGAKVLEQLEAMDPAGRNTAVRAVHREQIQYFRNQALSGFLCQRAVVG